MASMGAPTNLSILATPSGWEPHWRYSQSKVQGPHVKMGFSISLTQIVDTNEQNGQFLLAIFLRGIFSCECVKILNHSTVV